MRPRWFVVTSIHLLAVVGLSSIGCNKRPSQPLQTSFPGPSGLKFIDVPGTSFTMGSTDASRPPMNARLTWCAWIRSKSLIRKSLGNSGRPLWEVLRWRRGVRRRPLLTSLGTRPARSHTS